MPGPRNQSEKHLVKLAQGDPGFLADASELLGYDLEEPHVPQVCPRCNRTLDEDDEEDMVESAAVPPAETPVLICHDCEIAEERIMLLGGVLPPRERWPLTPGCA